MEANLAYYRRRSAEEAVAAKAAAHPKARQVHLELAGLYTARIVEHEAKDAIAVQMTPVA
jgi:hypothetical protein